MHVSRAALVITLPAATLQTEADAEAKAAELRIRHVQKQLAQQQKALTSMKKEGSQLLKDLEQEREAVELCRQAATTLGYDPAAVARLETDAEQHQGELQRWHERVEELSSQLAGGHCHWAALVVSNLMPAIAVGTVQVARALRCHAAIDFRYSAPERNFDHARVKGVVAKLTHVAEPATSTALEVAAGGKLYQVVVDSELTAKALLANGQLRQRVTIIPLNKVSARDIPLPAVAAARRMAGDKAQPALELVGYDQELTAAMKYVFGGCFICKVGACGGPARGMHGVAGLC